jgi:hypothetical protein
MADIEKLKGLLRAGVLKERKFATGDQLEKVAKKLDEEQPLTESQVQEQLEKLGGEIVGDKHIFASTDIDDIITVISQKEKK